MNLFDMWVVVGNLTTVVRSGLMRLFARVLLIAVASGVTSLAQNSDGSASYLQGEPLRLVQTITLPPTIKGNFDHFGIDLKRNRLFATPEDFKAVLVFDLTQGKLVHQIDGII